MKKDIIRTAAKKRKEARTTAEAYVGQDILFWADFTQKLDKFDDLAETIFYLERKNGLEYGKEQNARWIIEKIKEISKMCDMQLKEAKKIKDNPSKKRSLEELKKYI
ncbi:MAG: hypothetical protein D4S01_11280 [Dehalococcoidia bacterium]|nr:MAG: hypothetical protein D4S01_11280 [Dehalococcoidia bacterium]